MPYTPIFHVSPTSNIVERLFSRCGLIMRPHRRLMDPSTLEMLVMLRFCRDLWSARELDMLWEGTHQSTRLMLPLVAQYLLVLLLICRLNFTIIPIKILALNIFSNKLLLDLRLNTKQHSIYYSIFIPDEAKTKVILSKVSIVYIFKYILHIFFVVGIKNILLLLLKVKNKYIILNIFKYIMY